MKMEDEALKKQFCELSKRFEHIFGSPFHPSTFADQKKWWQRAWPELWNQVLKAGRSAEGLWSVVSLHR